MLLVLSFVILDAAVVQSGEKTFDRTFPVSAGGTLTFKTDVGSVEVIGVEDGKEVSVHGRIHGRQRDVDEFKFSAKTTATGVEVVGKLPSLRRCWNFGANDLEVSFKVNVPKHYNIYVRTSGGDLVVKNVQGKVEGGTSGGDIALSVMNGAVALKTSGGNIHVERSEGALRLESSGGNIRVNEAKGNLDASTSGGDVVIGGVEGKVRAETSGGDITVYLRGSHDGIYAQTSGGDIDIVVPATASANLDAETSGGCVSCELPVTILGQPSESRMRGTINGGGATIFAHTSGGDVRIRSAAVR